MKIIQIITELYPAGAEKILLNLSAELKKRGHDVKVISLQSLPNKQTDIVDSLKSNDISIVSLNITKWTPWKVFKIIRILKQEINNQALDNRNQETDIKYETPYQKSKIILHSHLIHANLTLRFASIFLNRKRIKIINTIHIAEKRASKWWHFFFDKLTFKLCDVQTAVSGAVKVFHAKKMGICPDKISVIYNGITLPKRLNKEQTVKLVNEWNFEDCTKIIGSAGRLNWQKGYDIFLENIPELSAIVPENEKWGIVILGEGEQRDHLEKIINKTKCENIKIILPGYRKDAADCIGAFNLFIMPSRYEGFGLTLIEAMAHGIPILANNIDSLPELIEDYSNGATTDFSKRNFLNDFQVFINQPKKKPYFQYTVENMTSEYLKFYLL